MALPVILIVDDEKIQRESLGGFLKKKGFETFLAESAEKALEIISGEMVDIVFTDFKMGGKSGFELLQEIKQLNPEITVILMTAFGRIEDAVQSMKSGAFDYLTKPIDLDEVELIINRAAELKHLIRENLILRERLRDKHRFGNIITNSSLMEEILSLAARAANSKASVLILGESGTGKELIARAIHYASPREEKPIITVNCAAISENLLESELFGHEKGAFTGAIQQKAGLVEQADGGTLFLDEVGDIPLTVQVKLLRFLQFGEFQHIGETKVRKVDVRLITATNRNIEKLIEENKFREDFYYRLNVINILIPALRRRKEDIPLLIDYFIKKYAKENDKNISRISSEALDTLMKYNYPGNIRELENLIERMVVLARDEIITSRELPIQFSASDDAENKTDSARDFYKGTFKKRTEAFEKDLIEQALKENNFNQSKAARSLGMNERNMRYKIKKYGLK